MSLDGFWHECMYVTYVNVNVCLWYMFYNMFLAQVCCGVTVFVGGWGVTPTRKSFRFVRACARSGYQNDFQHMYICMSEVEWGGSTFLNILAIQRRILCVISSHPTHTCDTRGQAEFHVVLHRKAHMETIEISRFPRQWFLVWGWLGGRQALGRLQGCSSELLREIGGLRDSVEILHNVRRGQPF